MSPWWQDLSDDELRARLVQRGLSSGRTELLVRARDAEHQADIISELLGPE